MSPIARLKTVIQENRHGIVIAALLPLMLAATRAAPDPAQALAGRYYRQFPDASVTGEKYRGEDIVEIVPVSPAAAYFRVHLDYYNGHTCGIFGVARSEGGALVYRDPDRQPDGRSCVLRLQRSGGSLSIDDEGGSCKSDCGARGSLSDVKIPYASRRPITYLARLKGSPQYRDAIREWRKDRK